jgi:LacI family transcriptional regulator
MKPLKNGHITIKQVAQAAGVSGQTVSRVINNRPDVLPETRQRIQHIIDQMGYQPNAIARSLIQRRSHTLGIVASGLEYYGPSRTVVGIEKKANELGFSVILSLFDEPDNGGHERALNTLVAHRVDGIIWAVPEVGNNRAWVRSSYLEQLPPIVFISMGPRPGISVVAVDNRLGARQAVQHLIDQGRRRIGIITGPLSWWEARERLTGWQEALQNAGLEPSGSMVAKSDDWSAVNGERGMQALWKREPEIDAVFASNDQIALGAMGVAHQQGKRIPQDLAVVGFDNIPEAAFFWPSLTTIYQQLVDAGCIAVNNLHEMILARRLNNKPLQPSSTLLKPELVMRASSAQ